jgi:hypothetical protein
MAAVSPWTEIDASFYNNQAGSAYFVQSTAGAQGVNCTQASGNSGGIIAAFKKAGGAGPSCKGKLMLLGVGC